MGKLIFPLDFSYQSALSIRRLLTLGRYELAFLAIESHLASIGVPVMYLMLLNHMYRRDAM